MATPTEGAKTPKAQDTQSGDESLYNKLSKESAIFNLVEQESVLPEGGFVDGYLAGTKTSEEAERRTEYYLSSGEDRADDYETWVQDAVRYEVEARATRKPASESKAEPKKEDKQEDGSACLLSLVLPLTCSLVSW